MLPSQLAQSHRQSSTSSFVMAAVQEVQLRPAFWGEQAVCGPHYCLAATDVFSFPPVANGRRLFATGGKEKNIRCIDATWPWFRAQAWRLCPRLGLPPHNWPLAPLQALHTQERVHVLAVVKGCQVEIFGLRLPLQALLLLLDSGLCCLCFALNFCRPAGTTCVSALAVGDACRAGIPLRRAHEHIRGRDLRGRW